jgi:hypothetical protein
MQRATTLWFSSLAVLGFMVTVTTGCQGPAKVRLANKRVEAVLFGLQSGGGSALARDLNTPVCQWYKGTSLIADQEEMRLAERSFASWRQQKKLHDKKISSFEVVGAEVEVGSDPIAVIVSVTIDTKPLKLRVIEGQPMTWVD